MNIYIWERLSRMSSSYHPEGGVVVIAESLERAREHAKEINAVPKDSDIFEKLPDCCFELASKEAMEQVFLFPDAGCC